MNTYVAISSIGDELYHHGIKGQKWGVRNYQNPDGSLTPEGRLRYGRGGLMSQNTKERVKQGAKIGAKIGTAVGTIGTGLVLGGAATLGAAITPGIAVGVGATYIGSYVASGAARGALIGGIYGSVETHEARKLMKEPRTLNVKVTDLRKRD